MPTEAEFEAYKEQLKKEGAKRVRTTSAVFGVLAIIALISMVYAFFQNAAAVRAQLHAEAQMVECMSNRKELEIKIQKNIEELEKSNKMVEAAMKEAERQYQNAVKAEGKAKR